METDRRGFLRWTAAASAWWLAPRPARAAGAESALAIHRATRNTAHGAVGAVMRRAFRDPLPRSKPYPGRPRLALPAPSWQRGRPLFDVVHERPAPRDFAREACAREELARVLFLANGVTERGADPSHSRRAAPSAGALYAGELYVVAERIKGLAPGVYSYAVDSHELVSLREGAFLGELARALERPDRAANAAAAVVVTNVFERYAVRYANRGYRYSLIDTGHIGENLRLAAREIGWHEESPPRFEDDALNRLLEVDGRDEAVCAVHLVGRAGASRGEATAPRTLVERQLREPEGDWSELPEPQRYHEATKLVAAAEAAARPAAAAAATSTESRAAGGGTGSDTPVHAAIRKRRSAERFESGSIERADLLPILALARDNPALDRSPALHLYAVVHRVAGTPAGVYRYDRGSGQMQPLRVADLAGPLVRVTLGQQLSGQAAAALIGVARLDDASAVGGARSYRDLLVDAGATAERVYLGAEALGLAARNLAAYLDDDLDALLGLDGRSAVAVHLTAVGRGD